MAAELQPVAQAVDGGEKREEEAQRKGQTGHGLGCCWTRSWLQLPSPHSSWLSRDAASLILVPQKHSAPGCIAARLSLPLSLSPSLSFSPLSPSRSLAAPSLPLRSTLVHLLCRTDAPTPERIPHRTEAIRSPGPARQAELGSLLTSPLSASPSSLAPHILAALHEAPCDSPLARAPGLNVYPSVKCTPAKRLATASMPMRSNSKPYRNLQPDDRENTPWYWRFIALAASWMILGGYLILPGLYSKDPQLKFSTSVLCVFVVALLTAGYSFTALLCFACHSELFQAESIFLPALTSSALGLLTIAYNFLASTSYEWGTAAISGTVLSATSTILYGALLLWTHRRIVKNKEQSGSGSKMWSEPSYYTNFISNMYPTSSRSPSAPSEIPLSEDDRINQQMALLLMKNDSGTSPDASSATFRIDLPDDSEERERIANSQELVGTPPVTHSDWNRDRADSKPSRPDSLGEQQAWARWQDRGRTTDRPPSVGSRSHHSRNVSREERRREIELGQVHT